MTAVDLFAGCGGLSLGFKNAGFDILAAFEYWDIAAKCYSLNFKHPIYSLDLSYTPKIIPIIQKYSPDIIIGGPPCQDFSHAGKRIEAQRAYLTECYADIIKELRPYGFVMENVARAHSTQTYARARTVFKSAGYGLTEIVLDASYCGVPQKRKRFFCIGVINEHDNFLLHTLNNRLSKTPITVRDYLGDSLKFDYYYYHPRNYNRRAIYSVDEPAPTMRGQNRPISPNYHGHPKDACLLNTNVRALTTYERSLIQTFPSDYKWCGCKTAQEQMIGNAVPVKLAEFVGRTFVEEYANSLHR